MSCGYSLKVGRVMRSKLTPFVFAGALTSALLGLTGGAHAATLVGSSISAEYDFPNLGTNLCTSCFTPSSFTVGSGIETTLAFSNTTITFDFSANQLVVNFVGGVGLNPATFSGPVFTLSGNPFPAIASVTGLPFANVTEPGDQLALNWITSSLTFNGGDQIVVTFVGDTSATPLPAALPLFATGLGAFGLFSWRKKRKIAST
jgi:hypothetical protein